MKIWVHLSTIWVQNHLDLSTLSTCSNHYVHSVSLIWVQIVKKLSTQIPHLSTIEYKLNTNWIHLSTQNRSHYSLVNNARSRSNNRHGQNNTTYFFNWPSSISMFWDVWSFLIVFAIAFALFYQYWYLLPNITNISKIA